MGVVSGLKREDAGDIHAGQPRGFVAGVIVEVWVALRFNWPVSGLIYEMVNCLVGVLLK